ncbi:MAG: hypothetical protein LBD59_10795 [Prevotellaceae bacterium]|jgi:enamine deaminase RidA (YjgF/YER057c/UK114 family)|nr:hypothetical protein [Prevotellaceae bacterium]
MRYKEIISRNLSVNIRLSSFERENAGEHHAFIEGNDTLLNANTQYANIEEAIRSIAEENFPHTATLVMKRYFVSDAVNHESLLHREKSANVAVSIVQQAPLSGAKVALWAYWVENARVNENGENSVVMQHSAYSHLLDMQMHSHGNDEFAQTEDVFTKYTQKLKNAGCSLADNAVRTWIFVQGVDTHYSDMVEARKQHFNKCGLTEKTHYIASTGIEGKYIHPETTVLIDAYAVRGIAKEQITLLKGASHLNPTHEYGVTFERAAAVDYGDRRHIFVSGTASINNKGEIVFPLDVGKQTERTLENIAVLLQEGGATMGNVAQMIVYLRDTADYRVVFSYLEKNYPEIPKTIVWAPVCRPGWLIEIECIAICEAKNEKYAAF